MSTEYKIRFIHEGHEDRTALPTTWSYPRLEDVFEGCQVLGLCEAMEIIDEGDHGGDDWFNPKNYSHIAIIEVSGRSGDSGPLSYWSVTEDDVEAMHVIDYTDSGVGMALEEIALEMDEEGHEVEFDAMGFTESGWWDEAGVEDVVARLAEKATTVEPTFIDYQ